MQNMSLIKFLTRYYGFVIDNDKFLTHDIVKKECPFIKRCSFEYVDANSELVATGRIVQVYDNTGKCIPYLCPEVELSSVLEDDIDEENQNNLWMVDSEESDELSIDKDSLLENMLSISTYTLRALLSKYKHRPSFYKVIRKELMTRGIYSTKQYKLKKRELKNREMEMEKND